MNHLSAKTSFVLSFYYSLKVPMYIAPCVMTHTSRERTLSLRRCFWWCRREAPGAWHLALAAKGWRHALFALARWRPEVPRAVPTVPSVYCKLRLEHSSFVFILRERPECASFICPRSPFPLTNKMTNSNFLSAFWGGWFFQFNSLHAVLFCYIMILHRNNPLFWLD